MSRLWAVVLLDGVEVSGEVEVIAGTWGDYWSPAESPEVTHAALLDDAGEPVAVDLEDEEVHAAILAGIDWPVE